MSKRRALRSIQASGFVTSAIVLVAFLVVGCEFLDRTEPPQVTGLAPIEARPGTEVTLQGSGFASEAEDNVVMFGDRRGRVVQSGPNALRVEVPVVAFSDAAVARVAVRVIVDKRESNSLQLDIGVAEEVAVVEPEPMPEPMLEPVPDADPDPLVPTPNPKRPRATARSKPKPAKATTSAPIAPGQALAATLAKAHAGVAMGQYQEAVILHDEVLKLEPANAEAKTGRENALRQMAGAKTLVASATRTQAGPTKKKAAPAGFDSADVQVGREPTAAEFEFKMVPASMTPGRAYKVHVLLRNLGHEPIELKDIRVSVAVNGKRTASRVALKSKAVGRGEIKLLAEVPGVWPDELKSWKLSTTVVGRDGDSYASDATWR